MKARREKPNMYHQSDLQADFPDTLSAPALRALLNAKITSIKELARRTEAEVLGLHGMGQSSIPKLRDALKAKGLLFRG